jgi:hypothetical protein
MAREVARERPPRGNMIGEIVTLSPGPIAPHPRGDAVYRRITCRMRERHELEWPALYRRGRLDRLLHRNR